MNEDIITAKFSHAKRPTTAASRYMHASGEFGKEFLSRDYLVKQTIRKSNLK